MAAPLAGPALRNADCRRLPAETTAKTDSLHRAGRRSVRAGGHSLSVRLQTHPAYEPLAGRAPLLARGTAQRRHRDAFPFSLAQNGLSFALLVYTRPYPVVQKRHPQILTLS